MLLRNRFPAPALSSRLAIDHSPGARMLRLRKRLSLNGCSRRLGWRAPILSLFAICATAVIAVAEPESLRYATPFLTHPPSAAQLAQAHVPAHELIVAKVRVRGIYWRGNRHGVPSDIPTLFSAAAAITEVLGDSRTYDGEILLSFGSNPRSTPDLKYVKLMYPTTPARKAREYFIAFYRDSHGENRLTEFSVDRTEYEPWEREFLQHLRERSQPGPRKR